MANTIRIDDRLFATLEELSEAEDRPIDRVLEDAVARYRKDKFWREAKASIDRLKSDPAGWADYKDEARFFEGASMDGLEREPPYDSDEELDAIRAAETSSQDR